MGVPASLPPSNKRVKIFGRDWKLRFVLAEELRGLDGVCLYDGRYEMRVKRWLYPANTHETICHEVTHAAFDCFKEKTVRDFARDLSRLLRRNDGSWDAPETHAAMIYKETMAVFHFFMDEDCAQAFATDLTTILLRPDIRAYWDRPKARQPKKREAAL